MRRPTLGQSLCAVSATIVIVLTLTIGAKPAPAAADASMTLAQPVHVTAQTRQALDSLGYGAVTGSAVRRVSAGQQLTTLASLGGRDLQALLRQQPDIVAGLLDEPPAADDAREWWIALPAAAQTALLEGAPAIVGNLDGVEWNARFLANRTNIRQATEANVARIAELGGQLESVSTLSALSASIGTLLRQEISTLQNRNAVYTRMHARQVLLFDPTGNGRYAEVHGSLAPTTQNIGVIVNGTTLSMDNVLDYDGRADSFWERSQTDDPGSLVTVTWMGIDFPDWGTYLRSELLTFATGGAPRLAGFVTGINEVSDARITVLGHSAGGILVGAAEMIGMPADAIVHVESAAAGPGVTSINDFANPAIPRYTLTAPGDPIRMIQSLGVFGENPADLAGITVLSAGEYPMGNIPLDAAAHDRVFAAGSEAWNSMYGVLVDSSPDGSTAV